MSTQQLQMPSKAIDKRTGRRIAAATTIVAALFAGALIGRSTATSSPTVVVRPAIEISTLGALSPGDAGRAEMFAAMNGLRAVAVAPTDPTHVSPGVEDRARHQRI